MNQHFLIEKNIITEDLVRYWFINVHSDYSADIEVPYYELISKRGVLNSRARADLRLSKGEENAVFEFKYHRKAVRSSSCTATNMGSVFHDLNRLSILDNKNKYLVYVFDQEMADYYEKNKIFNILKPSELKKGTVKYKVNGSTDARIAKSKYEEFKKQAFSGFNAAINSFSGFGYTVEVEYFNEISVEKEKFYVVIYKVI